MKKRPVKRPGPSNNHGAASPAFGASIRSSKDGSTVRSFQHWITSLDWKELQAALSFRLAAFPGDQNHPQSELELLREMVRLQPALPTPIHPRAIPFPPASARGRAYFDRRTEEQELKVRLNRPRLFQFISREATATNMDDAEAELLAMLTGAPTSSSSNKSGNKSRKRKGGNKDAAKRATSNATYDVIARQFRQADGELLSLAGGTLVSQQADAALLKATLLYSPDDPASGDASYWCCFDPERNNGDVEPTSREVIRMLRAASRGHFGTVAIESNGTNCRFAPWFDPEERWFHLSTFLASRFEVALWDSFHHRHQKGTLLAPPPPPAFDHLNDSVLHSLYAAAVAESMKEALREDLQKLNLSHVRDSLLWSAVLDSDCRVLLAGSTSRTSRRLVEELWLSPVFELGSKSEQWRQRIRRQFRALFAAHMERLLLTDGEDAVSDDTNRMNNVTKLTRRSSIRGKERKLHSMSIQQQQGKQSDDDTVDSSASSDGSEEEASMQLPFGARSKLHPHQPRRSKTVGFHTRAGVSAHERNRNTVFALSILEGVLDKVFRTVGLDEKVSSKNEKKLDEMVGDSLADEESREEPFRLIGSEGRVVGKPVAKVSGPISAKMSSREHTKKKALPPVPKGKEQGGKAAKPDSSTHASGHQQQRQSGHPAWSYGESIFPDVQQSNGLSEDPSATIRTSNTEGFQSAGYASLPVGFFQPPDVYTFGSAGWEMQGNFIFDDWGRFRGFDGRDESILTEFFHSQETVEKNRDEMIMPSSTAASVASSFDEEHDAVIGSLDEVEVFSEEHQSGVLRNQSLVNEDAAKTSGISATASVAEVNDAPQPSTPLPEHDHNPLDQSRSSTPSPPSTPPPTLSPILVSLSDLSDLRRDSLDSLQITTSRSLSSDPTTSLPPSPQHESSSRPRMTTSLSRENLRTVVSVEEQDGKRGVKASPHSTEMSHSNQSAASRSATPPRDDHDAKSKPSVRRYVDALSSYRIKPLRPGARDDHDIIPPAARETPPRISSYRNVAARASSPLKSSMHSKARNSFDHFSFESLPSRKEIEGNMCTQSETALDGQEDYQSWNDTRPSKNDEVDNTLAKDGSTTIASGASQREPEDIVVLREERNTYRDMCLTLGAEVAKLKTLLATAHQQPSILASTGSPVSHGLHVFQGTGPFDPKSVSPSFNIAPRARTLAAMSDAGYRGEHESLASEDEAAVKVYVPDSARQLSSGVTVAESDISLDHTSGHHVVPMPHGFQARETSFPTTLTMNGMQSRLAHDIYQFIDSTNAQLRKQESRKQAAMERITRLVCAVWPRALVKLYGSHVTGLCVPASDLDIVVCLPAVHKNAVADAAGALEGRNAIRETSQKQLARRLKGESWIDPRSMKVIDRTVVPVIKVSTKDTRARTLNLDISFDSPGHHGIEAVHMVKSVMEELPMLRPLVIVLKQFLIDRSLLEAYTGKNTFALLPVSRASICLLIPSCSWTHTVFDSL